MAEAEDFRNLRPSEIIQTVEQLSRRIAERFPDSRLLGICQQLEVIAKHAQEKTEAMNESILWLRFLTYCFVGAILGGAVLVFTRIAVPRQLDLFQFVQFLESSINDFIFLGAAIFFLTSLDTRIKRRRALAAIHELRSMAHLIDMQQLTKDPQRLHPSAKTTASSPPEETNAYELSRYLDYCSEMLSLTGKIGALYVTRFSDAVVLSAVNEIELFTAAVSNKIWQKLTIISSLEQERRANT